MQAVERFWLGLSRNGAEIAPFAYRRRPLTMIFRPDPGDYANAERVDFGRAQTDWLFIDALAIAGSERGPVLATSPLVVPLFIRAGHFVMFEPGTIAMNKRAILSLFGQQPQIA